MCETQLLMLGNDGVLYTMHRDGTTPRAVARGMRAISSSQAVLACVTDDGQIVLRTHETMVPFFSSRHLGPGGQAFCAVACGSLHVVALDAGGNVWVMGTGPGACVAARAAPRTWQPLPRDAFAGAAVSAVAAGSHHSGVITAPHGRVYLWGVNTCGELATPDPEDRAMEPRAVALAHPVTQLALGWHYTVLCVADAVWACGLGNFGQLGLGKCSIVTSPERVPRLGAVADVSCGLTHTAVVDAAGAVWTAGRRSCMLGRALQEVDSIFFERVPGLDGCGAEVHVGPSVVVLATDEGRAYAWGMPRTLAVPDGHSPKSVPITEHVVAGRRTTRRMGTAAALAVCMGRHARLGAASAVSCLDNDVLALILECAAVRPAP